MESTSLLIGCEIYSEENKTCIRPKADYLIVKKSDGNVVSLLFAGGSHCEIFEIPGKIVLLNHFFKHRFILLFLFIWDD